MKRWRDQTAFTKLSASFYYSLKWTAPSKNLIEVFDHQSCFFDEVATRSALEGHRHEWCCRSDQILTFKSGWSAVFEAPHH